MDIENADSVLRPAYASLRDATLSDFMHFKKAAKMAAKKLSYGMFGYKLIIRLDICKHVYKLVFTSMDGVTAFYKKACVKSSPNAEIA